MPLRVGIDLVAVSDIAAAIVGTHGDRYLQRLDAAREIDDRR